MKHPNEVALPSINLCMTRREQRNRANEAKRDEALTALREFLKPGDTVWTVLRHVSTSGMMRVIRVVKFIAPGEPRYLSWWCSQALGWGYDERREGVRVHGCGMDIGFHLIYSLSRMLYPDGFACTLGENPKGWCGGSQHFNDPHAKPLWHADGGYALNQRWL